MGDKFSSGIIVTRRTRIKETSENKQDCCWRWPLKKHWRKTFTLVEDETDNNTDAEMENQYRTEKAGDTKKIREGVGFFY